MESPRHSSEELQPHRPDSEARSTTAAADSPPKSESPAPPKPPGKAKRTLTTDNIFRTVADVVASAPVLFEATLHPRISAALREKLFLAVSCNQRLSLLQVGTYPLGDGQGSAAGGGQSDPRPSGRVIGGQESRRGGGDPVRSALRGAA